MTLGHNAEQGAEDNATGVAAILEAAATLNRLITSGKLPQPQRSIRILTMPEMYGSMHYIANHPERMRRTVAALTVDTPAASYELGGTEYTFYMNPQAASDFVDAFILKIAADYFPTVRVTGDEYRAGRPWHWHAFATGTDAYLGDPLINVPNVSVYSGSGVVTHHNSEDTPARVDARSLRDLSLVDAVFLYYLANAGPNQAPWLAELSENRAYDLILSSMDSSLERLDSAQTPQELGRALAQAKEKTSYLVDRGAQAIHSVERLVPETDRAGLASSLEPFVARLSQFGESQSHRVESAVRARAAARGITSSIEPVPDSGTEAGPASSIVVKRLRLGTITLDDLAPDQRQGYPSGAWDVPVITALYWCDGRRTLAEVIHLTHMELGPLDFDFIGYFRFLRKHGYVEFVKGD